MASFSRYGIIPWERSFLGVPLTVFMKSRYKLILEMAVLQVSLSDPPYLVCQKDLEYSLMSKHVSKVRNSLGSF
jgi:hypothetical protein